MRSARAVLVSVLVTLGLTLILQFFFGARAFGLFLLLPVTFLFRRKSKAGEDKNESNPLG